MDLEKFVRVAIREKGGYDSSHLAGVQEEDWAKNQFDNDMKLSHPSYSEGVEKKLFLHYHGRVNVIPSEPSVTAITTLVPDGSRMLGRVVFVTQGGSVSVGPSGFNLNDGPTWSRHDYGAIADAIRRAARGE
ncbi:MAG: hypothetical protein WCO16_02715 [bacterium]